MKRLTQCLHSSAVPAAATASSVDEAGMFYLSANYGEMGNGRPFLGTPIFSKHLFAPLLFGAYLQLDSLCKRSVLSASQLGSRCETPQLCSDVQPGPLAPEIGRNAGGTYVGLS